MFEKTGQIIGKNIKLMTRSKASALVIILGPLFLILLVGLAFSSSGQYRIPLGVYSPTYDNVTQELLAKLSSSSFTITQFYHPDACIDSVKTQESKACLIFPPDFNPAALSSPVPSPADNATQNNSLQLHVDYSEINLVYTIVAAVSSQVSAQAEQMQAALTQDLLTRLSAADAEAAQRIPTIVELVTAHNTVMQKITEASGKINSLDLQVGISNINSQDVEKELLQLNKVAAGTLLDARILISGVQVQIAKLQGNTTDIKTMLDRSENSFKDYETQLKSLNHTLESFVVNLSEEVVIAQTKLTSAVTGRNTAAGQLEEVKQELAASTERLNQIQVGMNNIKNTVSNLQIINPAQVASPFRTQILPITSRKTHFNYLFPTLLVLAVMITSVLLGATLVMTEKTSRSYFRNQITPTHDAVFLFATFLTAGVVVLVQTFIYLLLSLLFFHVPLLGSMGMTLFIVLEMTALFTMLGILLGTLFKSEETALLGGITLSSIMLLFSSTLLPLESMHPTLRAIASLNPFVMSLALLKEAIFFKVGISHLLSRLFFLLLFIIALSAVALAVQRWLRVHTLFYYHKLPGTPSEVQAKLLELIQRGGFLKRWFPHPLPLSKEELRQQEPASELEKSLLATTPASRAVPAKDVAGITKQVTAERKAEIAEEIDRLKREMRKL